MLWVDYYLYLNNLEETERNVQVLLLIGLIAILFFIAAGIEIFKDKYLHKIKNESVRKFIKKL